MKILVVGSGGREHALAWKIYKSQLVSQVICAPGNAGIEAFCRCESINAEDLDGLLSLSLKESVELAVIGPEIPLVMGIKDRLESHGISVFGPSKDAAQLEGSKIFSKEFFREYHIS